MVSQMSRERPGNDKVVEDDNRTVEDRSPVSDDLVSFEVDAPSLVVRRSFFDDLIINSAKKFTSDTEGKWVDARGQSGPAPGDLGEHEPIPIEAVRVQAIEADTENAEILDVKN